jgi:3-oxoacyl-[acyl-carrier protein] reductase
MDLGLKGKAALVTGASEGIGRAIARKLGEEGVRVAICARTVCFLVSERAGYVNGAALVVDGSKSVVT